MDWKKIAKELAELQGQDFEREMMDLAENMDESELGDLIDAVGELYPQRSTDEELWSQYESLCYYIVLYYGDVHLRHMDDEEYVDTAAALLRGLGLDNLADNATPNLVSRRRR